MSVRFETAAILIIGNEILSGRTQDKNTQWLAAELKNRGVRLLEVRVVPDVKEAIIDAVNALRIRYDAVFTSGGIGPTHDDITSICIAAAFGAEHGRHPEAERILKGYYAEAEQTLARMKMAEMPLTARLIPNPISSAPGFVIENVYVMAGVPSIFQAMFTGIAHEFDGGVPIRSLTVTAHLREGDIAGPLGELQGCYPALEIGSYPFARNGMIGTALVLTGTDWAELQKAHGECEKLLERLCDIRN